MIKIELAARGLITFIQIYYYIIFARIILSWVLMSGSGGKTVSDLYQVAFALTEPLLAPIRKLIPGLRMGMGSLDLSPILLLFLLRLVQSALYQYL